MNTSNYLKYHVLALILCLFFTFPTFCCPQGRQPFDVPKREVRAVWLTTLDGLDWPGCKATSVSGIERQKNQLRAILDSLQRVNINTVLFQARIRGTVVYPSAIEPWDACMTGTPGRHPGYDPMAFAVEECHRRGMEIQAWMVALPLGQWNSPGCRALRSRLPGIVMRHKGQGYIDPSRPASAQYLAGLCAEIASRYDVDGIHLDYIRYPETLHGLNKTTARHNITQVVEAVHGRIKAIRPWLKLSCAVIGKRNDLARTPSRGWNAFNAGCQDVETWMRRGLVDQLYPMMYFRGNQFYPFLLDWAENSHGCEVVPGLGIYMLSPYEGRWPVGEIERQMCVSRSLGMGFALFREKFLRNHAKPVYDFMKGFAPCPALVPAISGGNAAPPAPRGISVKRAGQLTILKWKGSDGSGVRYNVYASSTYPVDIADARNILAIKADSCQVAAKVAGDMYFAVTVIDRFGNESAATQQDISTYTGNIETHTMPIIDVMQGGTVRIPAHFGQQSTGAVVIRSIAGVDVGVRPCSNGSFSSKGLKCGFYAVYSLNQRGVTHRMFFLKITPRQLQRD